MELHHTHDHYIQQRNYIYLYKKEWYLNLVQNPMLDMKNLNEVMHMICDPGGINCYGYNGVSSYTSYTLNIHVVDGQSYEVYSADAWGDGWGGGVWAITDLAGNTIAGAGTDVTDYYTPDWAIDALIVCSAGFDCAGTCAGDASEDCAGTCNGDAVVDCAGDCGGSAAEDCAGTCNGSATLDNCDVCDDDASNDCVADCNGDLGGDAELDDCGVCGGDNSPDTGSCDCAGTPDGTATVDCAGTCDGGAVVDCAGDCGGSSESLLVTCDGGSWQTEVSWSISSGGVELVSGGAPYSAETCFAGDVLYDVSTCDSFGDSWNGNTLTIGSEIYSGPGAELDGGECSDTYFGIGMYGGCLDPEGLNYDSDADYDNGGCTYPTPDAPVVSAVGLDSPEDHADQIGYEISWTADPHATSYTLAWYDETEAPEIGDDCDYWGSAGLISCYLSCLPDYWIADGYCDYSNNCAETGYDGGDCCDANGLTQSDDPDGDCYEAPPEGCADGETQVTCGGGSYMGEVSWSINGADGSEEAAGGAPYEGCHAISADYTV